MEATYQKYILHFKHPSGTSRGVLTEKETWILKINEGQKVGYGECGILRGLSVDDRPDYEEKLRWVCQHINQGEKYLLHKLLEFPSIQMGLQTAFRSLSSKDPFILFPSKFTSGERGIPINGLIWMGEPDFMRAQIDQKLSDGFSCIKLKIGAIDFEEELKLIKFIRAHYSREEIELRVDANGGFSVKEAPKKLKRLSHYEIHSIEQPIRQGQWEEMKNLCAETPLPIALDEELIGLFKKEKKEELLSTVQPQYIILKPSLIGGFKGTREWIDLAKQRNIGWWITSALESNIGLNAIAQWTALQETQMPQGLGTGSLYTNNFTSPLTVKKERINFNPNSKWDLQALQI